MEAGLGSFVFKLTKARGSTQYFVIYPFTILLFHLTDFQEGAENKRTCYHGCTRDCENLPGRATCGGIGEALSRTKR